MKRSFLFLLSIISAFYWRYAVFEEAADAVLV